eukprot:GFUD01029555.1.p1 GENE.GFUD01029555.1~~GFUD01029555.1.p1  ORF type:complete len:412 (-),score=103.73 GFUD01029555.1:115-1311(-)
MAYAWSLLGVFKNIAKQIGVEDGTKIDSTTLRLNYKVTVSFLLVSSCIVTFHNWFGLDDIPIECIVGSGNKPSYLDDYCWLHPKNISIEQDKWEDEDFESRQEGVGIEDGNEKIFTFHYYQWTAFFLLFQAICFYLPRFVWVRWENGTMAFFKKTLDVTDKNDEEKANDAAEMLIERSEKGFNEMYSLGFMVSEVVSVVNIVFQWVTTSAFLGTVDTDWEVGSKFGNINFYNLGWKVMTGGDDGKRPWLPMRLMFPRQSTCVFRVPGPGGDLKQVSATCLLPLNIINDKIYLALWFWLVFVSLVTGFNFLYRVLMYLYKDLRKMKLGWDVLEREKDQQTDYVLDPICKKHSDFLIFENFSENFSKLIVRKTLHKIYEQNAKDAQDSINRSLEEIKKTG